MSTDTAPETPKPPLTEENPQAPENAEGVEAEPQTLTDHLTELRRRLTYCVLIVLAGFLACYGYKEELFALLLDPMVKVLPPNTNFQSTGLPETFFTYLKAAFVGGLFLTSPLTFIQLWKFIAPGLYPEERKYLIPIAFFSAFFFVGGASFGYFVVFPFAFNFFASFSTETIVLTPKVSEYFSFTIKLLIAFGIVFEMPLVVYFLARMGLVTHTFMRRIRKYAILCGFILSAILTPPDVVSQLCMAGPLLLLYEISIYVAKIFGRQKRTPEGEEGEEESEGEESAKA